MTKTWKPLEDGKYPMFAIAEDGRVVRQALSNVVMPNNNIRLCILTDAEPTIPATKDVMDALKVVLGEVEFHINIRAESGDYVNVEADAVATLRKVLDDIGEGQGDD